jgi:uncharacterized protein
MTSAARIASLGVPLLFVLLAAAPSPDPTLADAAMNGVSAEEVRQLIRSGADVNASQGDGMTALHWAGLRGDAATARLLVEAGARTGVVTRLGAYTPLHLAAEATGGEVVRILVEAGADLEARTSSGGATPLHLAARAGNLEAVDFLLRRGAEVDARDRSRDQTPLMYASAFDRTEVVARLLAAGADPSLSSRVLDVRALEQEDRRAAAVRDSILRAFRGDAALGDEARRPSTVEVQTAARAARLLLQSQSPVEEPGSGSEGGEEVEYSPNWTARIGTYGGLTPLLYAAREGHTRTALLLLDGGADINQAGPGEGNTPLLMATINGHFDLAGVLLERGADPNRTNASGDSPLYATVETRWAPRVIHPAQHAWMTQETTYLEMMERLLKAGADPNLRLARHIWYSQFNRSDLGVDMRGATPFWRAAHAVDLDAMRLLLAYGADPDIPTMAPPGSGGAFGQGDDPSGLPPVAPGEDGTWAIHAASGVGHGQAAAGNVHRHVPGAFLATVRFLVEELGADVNHRDHGGYTPLHHAAARGDNELILYLVEMGADVTVVSRQGQTTVDMANGPFITVRPIPETIALLESLGAKNNHACILC